MKKSFLSGMLAVMMAATLLAGCGGSAGQKETKAPETQAAETQAATEAAQSEGGAEAAEGLVGQDEGAVLNIHGWNEEFKSRVAAYYPGYEEVDANTGKIGNVTVKWTITPSTDNAYQNELDSSLPNNATAAADDKVDMFVCDADYVVKYVQSEYTASIADLGIDEAELANQYQYTIDVGTDQNGTIKGLSWQACPGVLIYNRAIAKEVLGSDDPATVQEAVKDWDAFNATAAKLKEAGYTITSGADDMYRVFNDNASQPCVVDGKIVIDDQTKAWVDEAKMLVDGGMTNTYSLWGDEWNKGFFPNTENKPFCYFGPAWLIDFCMAADDASSIAANGGWGAVEGPMGFSWGGTWILGAADTDNPTLVGDIMRVLTTNDETMKQIVLDVNDFANNKPVMNEMAQDPNYSDAVLGGQNALPMFCAGAEKISKSNLTIYDQGYTEEIQKAMKNYFEGNATYEEALEQFYKAMIEKYPELTH